MATNEQDLEAVRLVEAMSALDKSHSDLRVALSDIRGDIRELNSRTALTKTTVVLTGLTVLAVLIAILTYGQQWFGLGLDLRPIIDQAVKP